MTETHEPAAVLAAAMTDEALLDEWAVGTAIDPYCGLDFDDDAPSLFREDLIDLIRAARQEVIDAVIAEHPVEAYQSPLGDGTSYYCVECYTGSDWMSTDPLDRCATVRALRPWIEEEA